MAGIFTSILIVIVSLYFTGFFQDLPLAILAATIIVSIWKLVEFQSFIETLALFQSRWSGHVGNVFSVVLIDISTGLIIGYSALPLF